MSIYFYLQSDSSSKEEEEEEGERKKKPTNSFSLRWKLQIQKQAWGIRRLCGWGRNTPHKTARTSFGQS